MNWETLSGDAVQDLVAALIIMSNAEGNQITASRGDRGIDAVVRTTDGEDVYQIKKYARPLTTAQRADVEKSWATFVRDAVPGMRVRSWNLVMPWNPSNERLEWLRRLCSGQPFPARWLGRTQLDVLAAARPDIVDYYTGGGQERLLQLMASAIAASKELPLDLGGEQLLAAVIDRQRQLGVATAEINPFYRYDIQIRPGRLSEEFEWPGAEHPDNAAAMVNYQALDGDEHLVIRIIPKSPMSAMLAPIRQQFQFTVRSDDPDAVSLEHFAAFGTPLDRMPAVIVRSEGPPGTIKFGEGLLSTRSIPERRTDFELRLTRSSSTAVQTVALAEAGINRGLKNDGLRLVGADHSGLLHVEALFGSTDSDDHLAIRTTTEHRPSAVQALPAVEFIASLDGSAVVELAVAGGKPFAGGWQPEPMTEDPQTFVMFFRALTVLQRHTDAVVRCPAEVDVNEIRRVLRAARLLQGEVLQEAWSPFLFTINDAPPAVETEFQLMLQSPMVIDVGGDVIMLDHTEMVHLPTVRIDPEGEPFAPGATVRFIPGTQPISAVRAVATQ